MPWHPLLTLPGLVHVGVTLPVFIFGGTRCVDDGGIHHATLSHEQTALRQMGVDLLQNTRSQLVLLKQAAKLEQGGGIRCLFT
jgi:hypothetical protein